MDHHEWKEDPEYLESGHQGMKLVSIISVVISIMVIIGYIIIH